jgi:hypothetical protein
MSGPRRRRRHHTIGLGVPPGQYSHAVVDRHAGSGDCLVIHTQTRLLSELAPAGCGHPETYSSRPDHNGGGTFFVSVANGDTGALTCTPPAWAVILRAFAYAAFTTAPAGTAPVVAYRHNAISNLRASATTPMRRARLPRLAKPRAYQRVKALSGCHRIQFHAS